MVSRLNPYLSFAGDAREAMTFYERVLGGTLTQTTFGEFGIEDGADPEAVMHAMLETDAGFTLMAGDAPPGTDLDPGNNIAVSLSGDDVEQLRGYWAQLIEHGTVTVPLERQMWGDEFGACVDRFGVPWLVNITHPEP